MDGVGFNERKKIQEEPPGLPYVEKGYQGFSRGWMGLLGLIVGLTSSILVVHLLIQTSNLKSQLADVRDTIIEYKTLAEKNEKTIEDLLRQAFEILKIIKTKIVLAHIGSKFL